MAERMVPVTGSRQRGLALITAMLVVAIAATVSAYVYLDQQVWLRQAQNLSDRAQAEVVRGAAEEWAITILDKDAKNGTIDDLKENWAQNLPFIPVEGGQITGHIVDAQSRFNLNNLVQGDKPVAVQIGVFKNLLQSLSIDPNLSDAVVDWIDTDNDTRLPYGAEDTEYLQLKTPYRAANRPMQSVDELRLVRGFTPEIVEKLRDSITVLPQTSTAINVNTASKEVLSALFYPLPVDDMITQRPYSDKKKLDSKISELATGAKVAGNFAPYGLSSNYFEVEAETQFGRYRGSTLSLIERPQGGMSHVLWHSRRLPAEIAAALSKALKKTNTSPAGNI